MFSEHMHSPPQVWICSGSFGCNPAQRQHFPSLQLILLYFLIYAPCLGSVDYNYTKKRMASCILCHALIKNLITPLHHSCIQKSRYLEGLTKPSVCFYWAPLICVFRPTLLT